MWQVVSESFFLQPLTFIVVAKTLAKNATLLIYACMNASLLIRNAFKKYSRDLKKLIMRIGRLLKK